MTKWQALLGRLRSLWDQITRVFKGQSEEATAPISGAVASPYEEAPPEEEINVPDLDTVVEQTVTLKDKDIESRREWTRLWLTIAFVVMFLAVFGTAVFGAVKGGETHENISEVVNGVLPFVTAFGGYVASFYFPQNGGGRRR